MAYPTIDDLKSTSGVLVGYLRGTARQEKKDVLAAAWLLYGYAASQLPADFQPLSQWDGNSHHEAALAIEKATRGDGDTAKLLRIGKYLLNLLT